MKLRVLWLVLRQRELRCETYAHFLENYVPDGIDVELYELKKIEE